MRSLADSGVAVAVTTTAPRLGTATVAGGILTYAPNPNANGSAQVSYTVTVDGKAANQSTATINITPVNGVISFAPPPAARSLSTTWSWTRRARCRPTSASAR